MGFHTASRWSQHGASHAGLGRLTPYSLSSPAILSRSLHGLCRSTSNQRRRFGLEISTRTVRFIHVSAPPLVRTVTRMAWRAFRSWTAVVPVVVRRVIADCAY